MSKLLKDSYNHNYISLLSNNLKTSINKQDLNNSFCVDWFTNSIFDNDWESKKLKERMCHIAITIKKFLPYDYTKCITILKEVFANINKRELYLQNMIFANFVALYGLDKKHYYISVDALAYFTINSSSEFAIREFILKYPNQTLKQMKIWAKSTNEHIRRLASEGSRIRLPWGVVLKDFEQNPQDILDILEILKADKSKYVAKSVANNLNDISKTNPDMVLQIAKKWQNGKNKNTNWIIKHALRSLLKQGNKQALQMLGFVYCDDIKISNFYTTSKVKANSANSNLDFSFLISQKDSKPLGKLRIEYCLYFKRANNKTNKKIFFISQNTYKQTTLAIHKKYSFKSISTRVYYKGLHKISIVINGKELVNKDFLLE